MRRPNYSYIFLLLLTKTAIGVIDEKIAEANVYIDQLLENLRNDPIIATEVEPIHIPDVYETTFEGRNIYVKGLSYLTRLGDSRISIDQDNIYISCLLGVDRIIFQMDYKAKGQVLGYPVWGGGTAEGKIDHVIVDCVVVVSSLDVDGIGILEKFKVLYFGGFVVTNVKGTTATLNWIMTYIANVMFNYSKKMVIEGIENGISKLLQNKLSETKIEPRILHH
ncbi:uncharacterized protein LOC111625359 [Centruroides sculpturatus]|uniref:uncharacterized protein LOC111625359 n=1 Tax=Centruroides sculpturatus TaxID=218467 RepID=UPI000C6D82BC|nr:uncharacterized protein LOC111625359 [Centruroides sculpturatus]